MNIKSITYLAIIVMGFGLGFVFPFAEMTGVSLSSMLLALFLPYFGWKNTLKINLLLLLFMLPMFLSTMLGMNQWANTFANKMADYVDTIKKTSESKVDIFFTKTLFVSPLIYVAEFFSAFIQRTMMIWTARKVLTKLGVYKMLLF